MATGRSLVCQEETFCQREQPVAKTKMPAAEWVRKGLSEHGTDLLQEMVAVFARLLMSADVDSIWVFR